MGCTILLLTPISMLHAGTGRSKDVVDIEELRTIKRQQAES